MTVRAKKIFSYALKLVIFALAFWFIYQRILKNNENLRNFQNLVAQVSYSRVITTLLVIVLLMFINWLLESLKWWYLAKKLTSISVWLAIQSVFCGLTCAVITPNRFGEYGGRVMFLPVRRRIYGIFAMAVGSFAQNVITNVLGAAAVVWFLLSFIHLNNWLMVAIALNALIFMALMLAFYFNMRWVVQLLNRIKFLKKFHRFFDIMGRYPWQDLLKVMLFSVSRFFVFTFQYYLIIHLLVPQIPFVQMSLIMFVFFFVQSAIPSLDIFDIAVRGALADTLFGYVTHQHIAIMAAISIIYIVNLIIPAILGSVFVFKLKFFDRTA